MWSLDYRYLSKDMLQLFDRLKMEQPEAIKKISVVKGDVSCLELGKDFV